MPDPKVYVTAFFCERLLNEEGGVLSAIRMTDTWLFNAASATSPNAVALVETTFVVGLKCETPKDAIVTITGIQPDAEKFGSRDFPVKLSGGINGHAIVMPLLFQVKQFGMHWMEVSVDGVLTQRTPLLAKMVDQ